jgi:hypothetical protein
MVRSCFMDMLFPVDVRFRKGFGCGSAPGTTGTGLDTSFKSVLSAWFVPAARSTRSMRPTSTVNATRFWCRLSQMYRFAANSNSCVRDTNADEPCRRAARQSFKCALPATRDPGWWGEDPQGKPHATGVLAWDQQAELKAAQLTTRHEATTWRPSASTGLAMKCTRSGPAKKLQVLQNFSSVGSKPDLSTQHSGTQNRFAGVGQPMRGTKPIQAPFSRNFTPRSLNVALSFIGGRCCWPSAYFQNSVRYLQCGFPSKC